MSAVIARDTNAADQLVYTWPYPIGTECEVACSSDETVILCPAWQVGPQLGPGKHRWRTPDPMRPTAAYFVLTGPVEVGFDFVTQFVVPLTQQPVRIRANGSLTVRCKDARLLVAQFVGLPFYDIDRGIRQSVARSIERILARLLVRRTVLAGSAFPIIDPAMRGHIIEELIAHHPTGGAVFGIEFHRVTTLDILVDDGQGQLSQAAMPRPALVRTPPPGSVTVREIAGDSELAQQAAAVRREISLTETVRGRAPMGILGDSPSGRTSATAHTAPRRGSTNDMLLDEAHAADAAAAAPQPPSTVAGMLPVAAFDQVEGDGDVTNFDTTPPVLAITEDLPAVDPAQLEPSLEVPAYLQRQSHAEIENNGMEATQNETLLDSGTTGDIEEPTDTAVASPQPVTEPSSQRPTSPQRPNAAPHRSTGRRKPILGVPTLIDPADPTIANVASDGGNAPVDHASDAAIGNATNSVAPERNRIAATRPTQRHATPLPIVEEISTPIRVSDATHARPHDALRTTRPSEDSGLRKLPRPDESGVRAIAAGATSRPRPTRDTGSQRAFAEPVSREAHTAPAAGPLSSPRVAPVVAATPAPASAMPASASLNAPAATANPQTAQTPTRGAEPRGAILAIGGTGIGVGTGAIVAGEVAQKIPAGGRCLFRGADGLMQAATVRQLLAGYYEIEIGATGEIAWVPMANVVPQ